MGGVRSVTDEQSILEQDTGLEPVTFSLATKHSTTELILHLFGGPTGNRTPTYAVQGHCAPVITISPNLYTFFFSVTCITSLCSYYNKLGLYSKYFWVNLVLTTGFEPATGFLLRITKPVLSAIQPSQQIGRFRETRTLMMSCSQSRRLTN